MASDGWVMSEDEMRATLVATAFGAVASLCMLGGCETFDESYLIQQDVIIDSQNVRVTSDLEENGFSGNRWFQFRAFNSNDFDVCVRVTLKEGSQTSGHSMGGLHRVGPSQMVDVGYINSPANFHVNAEIGPTGDGGECQD
jgi:hypothetical protein